MTQFKVGDIRQMIMEKISWKYRPSNVVELNNNIHRNRRKIT